MTTKKEFAELLAWFLAGFLVGHIIALLIWRAITQ